MVAIVSNSTKLELLAKSFSRRAERASDSGAVSNWSEEAIELKGLLLRAGMIFENIKSLSNSFFDFAMYYMSPLSKSSSTRAR